MDMVLVAIGVMAAFGSMTLMVFDPISLFTRTSTTSLVPAFDYLVTELDKGRYVTNAQGGRDWVKRPTVIPELCIGCGICEFKGPVSGVSAIVVKRHAPGLALPGGGVTG